MKAICVPYTIEHVGAYMRGEELPPSYIVGIDPPNYSVPALREKKPKPFDLEDVKRSLTRSTTL